GALATAIALSDLFGLKLTLLKAADFAHIAEIQSVTGLGTVTGLVYGAGAAGLVTEPGAPSLGRVDALIFDHSNYALVCAYFGAIEKSSVLLNEVKKREVNEQGRITIKVCEVVRWHVELRTKVLLHECGVHVDVEHKEELR
ncbi:hypothetical protein B9Q11_00805, partial [Candidatus Marsarchaeota G2 archaeon ECH_B_SAG-F08]